VEAGLLPRLARRKGDGEPVSLGERVQFTHRICKAVRPQFLRIVTALILARPNLAPLCGASVKKQYDALDQLFAGIREAATDSFRGVNLHYYTLR